MKIKTEIEMRQFRAALAKLDVPYHFVDVTSLGIPEQPSELLMLKLVVDGEESNVTIRTNCGKTVVEVDLDLLTVERVAGHVHD